MTKETYFEMCTQLNQEPIDSEIPIDMEDFPYLVQQTFSIYYLLTDMWDSMGGSYLGKDYANIFNLFSIYNIEIEETLLVLEFLKYIDSIRSSIVSEKLKQKSSNTK